MSDGLQRGTQCVFVPRQFELSQLDVHLFHHRWQRETFSQQQGEAVCHRDQTQIHQHGIVGGGGLGDDDKWSLQSDVHGHTETLLSKVSNAGRRLLRRLGGGGAQSFFSRLEVINEHLKKETDEERNKRQTADINGASGESEEAGTFTVRTKFQFQKPWNESRQPWTESIANI